MAVMSNPRDPNPPQRRLPREKGVGCYIHLLGPKPRYGLIPNTAYGTADVLLTELVIDHADRVCTKLGVNHPNSAQCWSCCIVDMAPMQSAWSRKVTGSENR